MCHSAANRAAAVAVEGMADAIGGVLVTHWDDANTAVAARTALTNLGLNNPGVNNGGWAIRWRVLRAMWLWWLQFACKRVA